MKRIKPKLTNRSREQLSRKQADKLAPPMPAQPQPQPVIFTGQQALDKLSDRQMLEAIYRMLKPVQRFFGKD